MPVAIASRRPPSPRRRVALAALVVVATLGCRAEPQAEDVAARQPAAPRVAADGGPRARVTSGRLYLPTYSHIYVREGVAEDLAVTLSIRNVSVDRTLVLESVRYYDTGGKLLEELMAAPAVLQPLETVEFFISTNDQRGGSGANAIVGWHADSPIVPPLVEAVMVRSISANQAYSFTTRGIELPTDQALPQTQAPAAPKPAEAPGSADAPAPGGDAPPPASPEG